jgi:hypothetical protein
MTVSIDKRPNIKSRRHLLDEVCINTIRTLAIDAIQAANSGHPGTPMAMAPVGSTESAGVGEPSPEHGHSLSPPRRIAENPLGCGGVTIARKASGARWA